MGRIRECIAEIKLAQELDPLSLLINTDWGWALYIARQYDQAIEQILKTMELDQNFTSLRASLGRAYLMKGMYREAITELEKDLDPAGERVEALTNFGHAHAVSGNRNEAQKALGQLKRLFVRSEGNIDPAFIAIIYAGLNERDQAFAWLNKAYDCRSMSMVWLKVEPVWDSLRSDPRFTDLLWRVGLANN
jgi:tetratricopeptide (TPR) repeat protein